MTSRRSDPPISMIGAFESTYQPHHDVDVAESTGHIDRRERDLELLAGTGVSRLRYPIRWHRIETEPGVFDWEETDAVLSLLHGAGWRPIVDLVHHTSHPRWLTDGFADVRFGPAFLRYVRAFAERYPWIEEYTLVNEPFSTLLLCGHEAIWPPYHRGMDSFVAMLRNVLPALTEASRLARDLWPDALHWWCDSCERHTGDGSDGEEYAAYANDRRFAVLDLVLGQVRVDDRHDRPFLDDLLRHGGAPLLDMEPGHVDVVGLDYYAHCQWHFGPERGTSPTPCPPPLADLIVEYAERYGRPVWLGETNLRGYPTDRASWLKYTVEQCEVAVARGVDLRGYCWFPFVDSCDWSSLLYRCERDVDPVGVYSIGEDGDRSANAMSDAYHLAARGATAAELPAFRFAEPMATWLAGYAPQMAHWDWREPPADHIGAHPPGDDEYAPLTIRDA